MIITHRRKWACKMSWTQGGTVDYWLGEYDRMLELGRKIERWCDAMRAQPLRFRG